MTSVSKTLVFAGETASADRISEMLNEAGVQHVVYHKNRPAEERAAALVHMSAQPSSEDSLASTSGHVSGVSGFKLESGTI